VGGALLVGEGELTGYQRPTLVTPPVWAKQASADITDGKLRISFRLPLNTEGQVMY
jgi:hypothetical protein